MKDRDGQKKEKRQSFSRHASISPSASVLYSPLRHVPTFVSSAPLPDIFRVIFFLSRRRRGFVGHWWGSARFHWVSPDFNKKAFCYRLPFVSFFFLGGGGAGRVGFFFDVSTSALCSFCWPAHAPGAVRYGTFRGRVRPVDSRRWGGQSGPGLRGYAVVSTASAGDVYYNMSQAKTDSSLAPAATQYSSVQGSFFPNIPDIVST